MCGSINFEVVYEESKKFNIFVADVSYECVLNVQALFRQGLSFIIAKIKIDDYDFDELNLDYASKIIYDRFDSSRNELIRNGIDIFDERAKYLSVKRFKEVIKPF